MRYQNTILKNRNTIRLFPEGMSLLEKMTLQLMTGFIY